MTVTRRDHGRGHSYLIDGQHADGVTTLISKGVPKPALVEWAGKTTANYAVDFWAELAELTPSRRLDRLNRARFDDRDRAANRGTEVHALAERLVAGAAVDVPDEIAGHVESYVRFLDEWDPAPVLVEAVVANLRIRYCGTLDLVADMRGERWLLDIKTGRSGVFGETALQLAAYARADVYLDADGAEQPMPGLNIARAAVVWVRADGYDVLPVDAGDEPWLMFRHAAWLARHLDDLGEFIGPALRPPARTAAVS